MADEQWSMPEITQENFRVLLPAKIAEAILIISSHTGEDCFSAVKEFYDSPVYSKLEREGSKYWWMSPSQLAEVYFK